jgi:outer membrane protein insertion porin family
MKILILLLALGFQQIATSPVIESIQVRGNRRTLSSTVRYQIQSRPGDLFDGRLLQRDVQAVRNLVPGMGDVRAELEAGANGGVIVVFYVVEKPQIRSVRFVGMSSTQEPDIVQMLTNRKALLTQGSPYDEAAARETADAIKWFLAERGRLNADVRVQTEAVPPNSVVVTFNIRE